MAGLNVNYTDWTPEHTRLFGGDPVPGNPNVGAGGSPEAQAFRASRVAPATADATADLSAGRAAASSGRLYSAGLRAGQFLQRAAPLTLGATAISDFGEHRLAPDDGVDSSAMGTLRAVGKGDFGGAYDSLKKGALETGMDLMSGAAKLIPGHSVEDALGGMRNALGNQLTVDGRPQTSLGTTPTMTESSTGGSGPGRATNPVDDRLATNTQAAPAVGDGPHLGNDPGSAVAGAEGVRKFTTGDGRTLYSNVSGSDNDTLMSGKPGVGSVPSIGNEAMQRSLRAADIYRSMNDSQNGEGGQNSSYIPGVNAPKSQYEQDTAARNAGVKSIFDSRGVGRAQLRQMEIEQGNRRLDLEGRGQDLSAAAARDSTQAMREGHKLSFESSVYGTDMGGKNARARLNYEMGKDNRDFGLRTAEFGQKTDQANFEQRQAGNKDLHEQIGNLLPPATDKDGKQVPDAATAARYASGLQQLLGQRRQELEQRAAQGDKAAEQSVKTLDTKGVGALQPDEIQRYVAGMKAADLAREHHSLINPFEGTGYTGDQPIERLVKKPGMTPLTDTYEGYVTQGGKQVKVAEIPARAVEKSGTTLGFGGQQRVDLNSLIH